MFESAIEAIDILLKAVDDDMKDKLKDNEFVEPEYTVDKINELEDKLTDILEKEGTSFADGIIAIGTISAAENTFLKVIEELKKNDATDEIIYAEMKKFFKEVVSKLANDYIQTFDKDLAFSVFTDRTNYWIDRWSYELGQIMKLTSCNELERILSNGLEKGKSIQEIQDEIIESYSFSRERARKVSITEVLTAHSFAKEEAIIQSPAVDRKEWKHSGTHKNSPRPHHQALDGEVIDKNKQFKIDAPTGTYYARFPRDVTLPASERINCHCTHRGIVNDDILGLSLDERKNLQQEAIEADNGLWEKELDAINRAKAGIE